MIDSYSFGSIVIDGETYNHDVIIFDGEISSWRRRTSHNVDPEDITSLILKNPKMIIFGTGDSGAMEVPGQTRRFIENEGIKVLVLRTEEAAKKFNELEGQPGIAAALHLTC